MRPRHHGFIAEPAELAVETMGRGLFTCHEEASVVKA